MKIIKEELEKLSITDLCSLSEKLWHFTPPFGAMEIDKEIYRRVKLIFPEFDVATKEQ